MRRSHFFFKYFWGFLFGTDERSRKLLVVNWMRVFSGHLRRPRNCSRNLGRGRRLEFRDAAIWGSGGRGAVRVTVGSGDGPPLVLGGGFCQSAGGAPARRCGGSLREDDRRRGPRLLLGERAQRRARSFLRSPTSPLRRRAVLSGAGSANEFAARKGVPSSRLCPAWAGLPAFLHSAFKNWTPSAMT